MFLWRSCQFCSFSLWERMCFYLARIFELNSEIDSKLLLFMATPVSTLPTMKPTLNLVSWLIRLLPSMRNCNLASLVKLPSAPFIMKVQELASLFVHISQLCQQLNILMPKCLCLLPSTEVSNFRIKIWSHSHHAASSSYFVRIR